MIHTRFILIAAAAILAGAVAFASPDEWRGEWPKTDFGRSAVDFREILSGGPPKDGIPALDDPRMIPVGRETRLADTEPVLVLELSGQPAHAWPIRYLTWHEIVNDQVGGTPVAVTFCPLCNAAMIFDRRLGGQVLSFGVTGKLRNSDLIMYDRQTESWWQQALGEGIVGKMTGKQLKQLPGWMESWGSFRARNPDGIVMDQPDWPRSYGRNPYVGYDSASQPFLYRGENPPHGIPPLSRVVRVGQRAWPLERVARAGALTEAGVTISWTKGQASALDSGRIAQGKDVGNVRVRDASSGRDVVHDVVFAFVFQAFHPKGKWMIGN
ncbi:hypothetical protein DEA8626_01170 [Defluviimonas aquaemixtae]|uniref:DUF3179 domain-containing protein n=1 Tax=Albidovulum aquaemixtae TaxID=1542388 RepID=A0A2R8B4T6_9RHOB|nr:DUF3179 domain-containing protein [Defluviimonas aquaemixtae]SPH17646.1 hypothetical protein DEA8626_01170 [Defluviimonas aquaemixtae]